MHKIVFLGQIENLEHSKTGSIKKDLYKIRKGSVARSYKPSISQIILKQYHNNHANKNILLTSINKISWMKFIYLFIFIRKDREQERQRAEERQQREVTGTSVNL